MLREADLLGAGTEAEAYMRVAEQRYRLLRTHEWSDEVLAAPARRAELAAGLLPAGAEVAPAVGVEQCSRGRRTTARPPRPP